LFIPVIGYSSSNRLEHFSGAFEKTNTKAALTAGILHREEVSIETVKKHIWKRRIVTR